MIRRLFTRSARGRRTVPPPTPYAGVDLTDTVLIDGANFALLPCEGPCPAAVTIHELTGPEAICRVCGTARPVTSQESPS